MFRRRSRDDSAAAQPPGRPLAPPASLAGKGRPTPSRKAAEAARKAQLKPAVDRREARRRRRVEVTRERERVRTALATGDESGFPLRDRGPVRRFVRDYVDSRRTLAEFMLPLLLFVVVLSFVPDRRVQALSFVGLLATMLLMVTESTALGFRIKRAVARRFPDLDTKGSALYGIARATQLRRLRLPKPAVRPGQPVRDS